MNQPATAARAPSIPDQLPWVVLGPLFFFAAEVVAAGAALVDVAVALADAEVEVEELGSLLASSARRVIARPDMTCPLLAFTTCVTLVLVTEMILPLLGVFEIPLLIRSVTPGGGSGMVKFGKAEFTMSDETQAGGVTVVLPGAVS